MKKILIKYGVCLIVVAIIAALVVVVKGGFGNSAQEVYFTLSDMFFVSGVALLSLGLLVFVAGDGLFDGIGFLFGHAVKTLLPFGRNKEKRETFAEYRERKHGDDKQGGGYGCMLIVGGAAVLLSILFVALYYGAS